MSMSKVGGNLWETLKMKKSIKILLLIIASCLIAIGLFFCFYSPYVYSDGQSDKFTIKIGESVSVWLHENGSTGYANCWINKNRCNSVKLTSEEYRSSIMEKLGGIGAGGAEKFTFMGTKNGADTIKFNSFPIGPECKTCSDFVADGLTKIDSLSTITFIITVTP